MGAHRRTRRRSAHAAGVRVLSDVAREVAGDATSRTRAYSLINLSETALNRRCLNDLLERSALDREALESTFAESCDHLSGMPFAFDMNIDGVGAWPPVYDSHVEMDG